MVQTPPDGAWPEAVDAIVFELEQAGLMVEDSTTDAAPRVVVELSGETWELSVIDPARAVELHASGEETDSPYLVALHAVELVLESQLAAQNVTEDPIPEPARPAEQAPLAEPQLGVATHSRPPVQPAPPRAWGVALGITGSSMGLVGLSAGVRHRWSRLELGLGIAGGMFAAPEVDLAEGGESSGRGGFVRAGLGLGYLARPGKRVRPLLGLDNDVVVPMVWSSFSSRTPAGPNGETIDVDESGISAGAFWTPTAQLGVQVGIRERLGFRAALYGGPSLTLAAMQMSENASVGIPNWVIGGTTALVFGRN